MKKIFTVLMALGIALCTVAGSTFSVAERIDLTKVSTPKMEKSFTPVEKTSKAVRMDKQEARQAMAEAHQAKTVAPVAVKGVRQIEAMPVATAQKQVLPVVNNKQRAAAQVAEATDTVEIVATTWVWKYYESDNDWYTTLIDATETYEIKLDYVSDTQAGTFTEDDCLMDYTGMYIYDEEGNSTIVRFAEVDIVVTDDENGLTLHAELLSTDNVLYVVDAYIAPLPEPKGNVELAYVNAELVDATLSSSAFQFSAFENNYYTSIFIYSDQVEGEYETIDMYDPYYNYIAHVDGADTTFVDFLDLHAVVTKEGKTYNLVADVLGSDTIMYHITMSYTKPDPTDTIDIVATNLYIDEFEFYGMVFTTATASNDEYEVTFDLSIALEEGEYATEDFNASYCGIVRTSDMAEIAMTEISATVTGEGGDRVIKAEVVGSDNVLYNMDLSYVVPEATDTVQVVFDELATAEYYSSSADYYIVNKNENYIVTLDIFEEKGNLMGEYSVDDFDLYYTQLGVINGDTTVVTIADAKAVVTPVEEGIVLLEAELTGMDAVLYKVSTKVDVTEKGLQYDATEGFLMDEYTTEDIYTINDQSANGYIMFDVEAADGSDLMGLVFWVDGADENTIIPTGTYQINDTQESGSVLASTGMGSTGLTYSLYATMEDGYIVPPCWFMVGGEVVVSEENGILSITVDAVNSNNLPIFITCEYDLSTKQGLQYDMTEGSVERTYSDADVVKIDTQYVAQYGQLNFAITAADASDMISMVFFVEEADAEIGIPAGIYTIDDSGDYGTVYASPGVQDNKIYPSFYGQLTANGGITVPCYFMVGGQVVVENVNGALKVTIDALNSYDVPAHIVYEATPTTPVEPVEMVGVVKRTLFNGYDVVVLTHEEDGTAHIYNIVEGDVLEVSQEGVIAVDPENAGDYLAISDIALTEDGKLVATNYMITQSDDTRVDDGYKRGETRIYIWNDLAGDPSILFTSKMSSNWYRSKQGLTMAVKGTSDNMEIFMTGIHATSAWARVSSYRVIDGVYVEPEVNHNDHYFFYDINDAIALETTVGEQYELNASPLGAMNWVLDAEKINPTEITEPETNNTEIATSVALTEDLGKKYNGASYITVGEAVYMVAPFANPDGELVGIEILNITNGFDAPQYVDMLYLDEAVSAQAAATAVTIVENTLAIALVVDAQYYMFDYELKGEVSEYEKYEDEITNLVIDLDNLVLIGGPSSAFQVDVYLPLGEYNMSEDSYQLTAESSIAVMGSDATFIEGYAYEIDAFTPSAKAVVRCEWNGMKLEFHLTMSAAPMEATVVVVEDAVVEIEQYQIWGDMYDYALTMTGAWVNEADGLTYPVLVEVPVYYPEATEPSEIMSTVTVGGWNDDDPWLGFGEGTLTVTTVDGVVTATGIVQNPMAGIAIDITISGKLPQDPGPGTGIEDVEVEVKAVKLIKNGQLIINRDGKMYNAQGAILK